MIKKVEISNIMSIDKCELSFDKAKYKYLDQFVLNNKVANPIAIYGRNGSGKTSFLLAINFVVRLLTNDINGLGPFISNFTLRNKKTSYVKMYFEVNNNEYVYHLETSLEKIEKEYLLCNESTMLYRKKNKYSFNNKEYEVESSFYPTLRKIANQSIDKTIDEAYNFLSYIALVDGKGCYSRSFDNKNAKDIMVEKSKDVKEIIKQYKSFPVYDIISSIDENNKTKEYYGVINKNNNQDFVLPFKYMSMGMKSQSLMLSILLSLPENGVMVIDELEEALHPLTIINFINEVIKRNVQLIFVSQNTNILSQLRPDNVVFANWSDGASTYKRLSDIYPNIREVNNIEKMYLSSTFDEEIEK